MQQNVWERHEKNYPPTEKENIKWEGESSEINLASGWGRRIWPFVQTAFTATQHFEKNFLKISTGIVVQTTGNTRAQLKCKIHRGLKNQAHQQIESLGWLF